MTTANDIGWGSYKDNEGPFWRGSVPFVLGAEPTYEEIALKVVSATEGMLDSVNCYDTCVFTGGLFQNAEWPSFGTSALCGRLSLERPDLLEPLKDWMGKCGVELRPNRQARFRFFLRDEEANTQAALRTLFFGSSKIGPKGSWTDVARQRAKEWAAAFANCWTDKVAQGIQVKWTAERLMNYVMPKADKVIFEPFRNGELAKADVDMGVANCLRYAYLSFAANNPSLACKYALQAIGDSKNDPWTLPWVIDVIGEMTFGPQIAIYPGRYNDIRPVLEAYCGVDLPDFAKELQLWQERSGVPGLSSTREIQQALVALGFDLGPRGVDGVYGPKTTAAVETFQMGNGLEATGSIDAATRAAIALRRAGG